MHSSLDQKHTHTQVFWNEEEPEIRKPVFGGFIASVGF